MAFLGVLLPLLKVNERVATAEMASKIIILVFIRLVFKIYAPFVAEPAPPVFEVSLGVTFSSVQEEKVTMLVTTRMMM